MAQCYDFTYRNMIQVSLPQFMFHTKASHTLRSFIYDLRYHHHLLPILLFEIVKNLRCVTLVAPTLRRMRLTNYVCFMTNVDKNE